MPNSPNFLTTAGLAFLYLLAPMAISASSPALAQPQKSTLGADTAGATSKSTPATKKVFSLGTSKIRNISKFHATEKIDLGNFNLFHGNTSQAIKAYRLALAIDPNRFEAHQGLCNCYMRQGKVAMATNEALAMNQLRPKDLNTLILLGNLYKNQGKLAEAIRYLEQAERQGAKSDALHTALGLALAQSNGLDEASRHLDMVLGREGKNLNADAHLGKAVVLYKQGKKEDALAHLDKSIKGKGGNNPQARNFKAEILYSLGRIEEAKAEYHTEIEKEDALAKSFQALGNIYLKEEKLAEALKTFDQGQKWYPRDADIALGKAVALEKLKKLPEAVAVFKKAIPLIKEKGKADTWERHLLDLQAVLAIKESGK
ncbi:MAG TPA: tetratricopeptide repeat protein [Candidatus Obscuribacter sp.]|nr:tetratricopeptide repeat protein [Candidatus Obscuribacter sp.]MBK9280190.1 tetratricopeptide repeat protein [Candidatus Obscuribacter sp.]HNG19984.1 tetratricopeptide repeat protein [Candidatus Obscuribacter sp.]